MLFEWGNLHVFIIIIEMSTKKGGGLKYFSEESTGFKITPKTVLIMSLIYIGIVVLLHIYAKLGSNKTATTDSASDNAQPESSTTGTPNAGKASEPEPADIPEP